MRYLFLTLAMLFLALPSYAVKWSPSSINPSNNQVAANWVTGDTTASGALDAKQCGRVTVRFDKDTSGASTDAAATLLSCSDVATPAASCTSTVLLDGVPTEIDTTMTPVLYLTTITAPVGTDRAKVSVFCQGNFAREGGLAPGIVGTAATPETIRWIGNLQTVPFPDAIEPLGGATWTDYYFSAEAGGDYPLGLDANDGLSPFTPKLTWREVHDICLAGEYRRCFLDRADSWTVANGGHDGNWALIEDDDIVPGNCLQMPDVNALEHPCYWIKSSPGGGQAHIDATATTDTADFMSWKNVADRPVALFENLKFTGDSNSVAGATPFDSFNGGAIVGVGLTLVNGDLNSNSGTNNISTCHDVSVTNLYGYTPMTWNGTAAVTHVDGGAAIGGQDVCAQSVISNADIWGPEDTLANTLIVDGPIMTPSAKNPDATLQAEYLINDAFYLRAGPTLRLPAVPLHTAARDIVFMNTSNWDSLTPFTEGKTNSGNNRTAYIMTTMQMEPGDTQINNMQVLDINVMGPDTTMKFHMIQSVVKLWQNPTLASGKYILEIPNGATCIADQPQGTGVDDCGASALPVWDFVFAGNLFEPTGDSTNVDTFLRATEDFWANSKGSGSFTFVDNTWLDQAGNNFTWRHVIADGTAVYGTDIANFESNWLGAGEDTGQFTFANNVAPAASVSATSTSGSTLTLVDTGIGWDTDEWKGCFVQVNAAGAVEDMTRLIDTNTTDTLTWLVAVTDAPEAEAYKIHCVNDPTTLLCNTGSCRNAATAANAEHYRFAFDARGYIPKYIAGKTLTYYDGRPDLHPHMGLPELP